MLLPHITPRDLRNVLDDILRTPGETHLQDIRDARRCIAVLPNDDVSRVLMEALRDHGADITRAYD